MEALRHWRTTQRSLHGADVRGLARIERLAAQWRKQLQVRVDNATPNPYDIGWLLTLAYPDRIAQARGNASQRYRLANGRGVRLDDNDPLSYAAWLAVAHLDSGNDEGRIYLAAPLHEDVLNSLAVTHEVMGWDARLGTLVARREQRVGELTVSSQRLQALPHADKTKVLCDVVRVEGLALLNWSAAAREWQARAHSVQVWRAGDWPAVSDSALLERVDEWLRPWLERVNKRDDFARLDLIQILTQLHTHQQQVQLNQLAPTHLAVPSGSHIRLAYAVDGAAPVLAVKLQEMFGLADTPTVNEGRTQVLLHLLSPAQRPIQVTQDLRSFWANTYPIVRKELRGRYAKHPWPEDPWNAPPTRRTVKRS